MDACKVVGITVDKSGRGVISVSDGRKIAAGAVIVASDGRKGIVTEVRPNNVYEDDPLKAAVFARPIELAYHVPFRDGTLITATHWALQADGKLHGLWSDGRLGARLTAEVEA